MHTPEIEREPAGLGETAKNVAEHASTLARLELELATLELKRKVSSLGIGIGLALGAAVLLLFVVGFGLATMAAGIATATPTWVALLIVTVFVALITALLAFLGVRSIKKGTPPVPEQALEEARLTTEALKADGHEQV
jgi:tetrahydromethanopterin S-methyltransferase subunit C